MLVLVILGILAGLVLPKFAGRSEQARVTAAVTQIATFNTALGAYEVDTGSYPSGQDGLRALVVQPADVTGWRGPYLESDVPLDPWQHPYIYQYPGQAQSERLRHHFDGAGRTAGNGRRHLQCRHHGKITAAATREAPSR